LSDKDRNNEMRFDELLEQVLQLLRREGRLSYRALKRRFSLDDEYIEDLKAEIIEAKRLAVDENGTVLVWTGAAIQSGTGSELTKAESIPPSPITVSHEGERRQLTVMFCDLVGSTPLSEQFDPEELRDLIRGYQHACSDVIAGFNGRIAKYLGDGMLAYFGYPLAHEDDAQRAVRAGLGIVAAMQMLSSEHGGHSVSLKVRLGIHTGLVVVGEMGGGEFREPDAIVGETPNAASRLQELAEPNSVVISGATNQLVRGLFDCEALGARPLKGFSTPLQAYRVLRETEAQSRFDVAMQAGLTPLVGRENESALLNECWERTRGGEGQVVLLSGEPGIGKSRLVQAFKERIVTGPSRWLECHCSPYHQNSAHYPVIDLLQRFLEFESNDSYLVKLSKLEGGLRRCDLAVADYLPLLASLLSLPVPGKYPRLTLTLEAQKENTHLAIQAWLLAIAQIGGLVLLFEDLHWADPSTLELLGALLDQVPTTRLLLVLTYRPEFAPPWPARSHFVSVALSRLPRTQSEAVVRNVSGGKPLPPQVLDQIISKTDGVPLFVEELTKTVLESDLLREHNGRYELTGPLPPLAIPSTLQDSLTARLDRLGSVRDVAQLAAAIGRDFSYELLRAISPLDDPGLHSAMATLVDAEVLYRRGVMPQAHYLFKHALIRDAAYESLLKSKRQQIHSRIARVLEEQFPETVQAQPELIAHHYTGAGLIAQAIPYWQKAGEQAVQRAAFPEAINYFAEGLTLLPEGAGESDSDQRQHELGERRCNLLLGMGEAQRRDGQPLKAQQTLIRAADIAQALLSAELVGRAARGLSALAFQFGLPVAPTATRLFEQTLERSPQDSLLRATILGGLATALVMVGENERALEYGRQSAEIARRLDDPEVLAMGLVGMLFALQSPRQARQRFGYASEMLGSARACDSKELISFALWWRAYSALQIGDVVTASQDLEEYGRWAENTREPFILYCAKNFQACQASIRGDFEGCERLAQEALAIGQNLEVQHVAGVFGTQMFTLQREQGRLSEVEPLLRHFMRTSEGAKAWGPGLALIYAELGRTAEARAQFDQVAASDFADIPHDTNWLPCMTYLADVCNFLGDKARAALLYERLLPYKKVAVLIASGSACYGSASRYLGTLATIMAHWDEAEQYFQDASAMNSAMGARPWLAHTQYQYARMLLTRDQPGDSGRAATLLKEALATARELGMRALEQRIASGSP
jgi:class 3 adenylate cyclase/tetratricopeptide (TPR) repeat protein